MNTSSVEHTRRLTLVRHGETTGASSIRYYGRTDVPLSDLGRAQMRRAAAALAAQQFGAVVASTLQRSVDAARIVGRTAQVIQVAGFDEVHFGDWEGLTQADIRERYPVEYRRWSGRDPDFVYPGGEPIAALHARVAAALHDVLANTAAEEVLLVLHKGVIRCIVAELLHLDSERRGAIAVELGSIHVLNGDRHGWRAEVLDRTDHL